MGIIYKQTISNKQKRRTVLIAIIMLCLCIGFGISSTSITNAQVKTDTLTPPEQAQAFAYYKALRDCQANVGAAGVTQNDVLAYNLFASTGDTTEIGVINTPDQSDAIVNCGGDEGKVWLKKAAGLFGYKDGPSLACDIGYTRENIVDGTTCTDLAPGENRFISPNATSVGFNLDDQQVGQKLIDDFWTKKLGNSSTSVESIVPNGGAYQLYLNSFLSGCKPHEVDRLAINTSSKRNNIKSSDYTALYILDPTTNTWSFVSYSESFATGYEPTHHVDAWEGSNISINPNAKKGTMDTTCINLAKQLQCPSLNTVSCQQNPVIKGMIQWQANNLSVGEGLCDRTPDAPGCPQTGTTKPPTSCAIENVGWIVCPVIGFLGNITDGLFGLIENLLVLNPSFANGVNTQTAWKTVLGIANVGLIIIFLLIVFSQLTNLGITNYGVKKMLPRLVVVAIAMQVSMWLCAVAVDVSNIAGHGIYGVLSDTASQASDNSSNKNSILVCADGNSPNGGACVDGSTPQTLNLNVADSASKGDLGYGIAFFGTIAAIAVVAAGALLWGAIGLLLPVLIAAVVAIAITLGILLMRWVLVVILIVLSPIAILLFVLPNTNNLFKTWSKWLIAMLTLYPMVALLFGGSKLVGTIIGGALGDMGFNGIIAAIIAGAVMVLPLFFTPKLLQGSLHAVPIIGGVAQKFAQRQNGRISTASQEMLGKTNRARRKAANKEARFKAADKKWSASMGADTLRGKISRLTTGGVRATIARTKIGQKVGSTPWAKAMGMTEAGGSAITTQKRAAEGISRGMADTDKQEMVDRIAAGESAMAVTQSQIAQHKYEAVSSWDNNNPAKMQAHLLRLRESGPEGRTALQEIGADDSLKRDKPHVAKAALDLLTEFDSQIYGVQTGQNQAGQSNQPKPPSNNGGNG